MITLWPWCLETNSGLPPIIEFHLTDEWPAAYGLRQRIGNRCNVRRLAHTAHRVDPSIVLRRERTNSNRTVGFAAIIAGSETALWIESGR